MNKKILAIGLAAALSVTAVGVMTGCNRGSDGSKIGVAVNREASSGTREVFEEKVVKDGVSIKDWLKEDGHTIPAAISEINNTSGVITQVSQSFDKLGYVSLGSYLENTDVVQAVTVDGVAATKENVQSGDYKLWRYFNLVYKEDALENDLFANFLSFIASTQGQTIIDTDYVQLPGSEAVEYVPYTGTETKLTTDGSTSVAPLMRKLADAFMKANNNNVAVEVQESGSGTGIQKAQEGTIDFGMSSRDLTAEEAAALQAEQICMDGVAVIVRKGSKCTAVTMAQIFDLYTALTPIVTEA